MNKFRILGIIAILVLFVNFIGGLDEEWKDFKKGYEDGRNSAIKTGESGPGGTAPGLFSIKLNIEPLDGTAADAPDSNRSNQVLPYAVTQIETHVQPSPWFVPAMALSIPVMLLFLAGFCSLIRLLIAISRRAVFTPANVRRLRWFAYTNASAKALAALIEWMIGSTAMAQTSLAGYHITGYASEPTDWTAVVLIVLFAEIFAIGVKLKEEQDLTI